MVGEVGEDEGLQCHVFYLWMEMKKSESYFEMEEEVAVEWAVFAALEQFLNSYGSMVRDIWMLYWPFCLQTEVEMMKLYGY